MSDITLSNRELLIAFGNGVQKGPVARLGESNLGSIKAKYALSRIIRQAEGALQDVEKARSALLKRYAVLGDDGEPVVVDGQATLSDPAAFVAGYEELLAVETTLAGVRPLTLDEVADGDLSALDLIHCGPFVVE